MQFLWRFNGAFVVSFRTRQPLVPIHLLWKTSLMFNRGKTVIQVRNDTRVSKQWQKCPFNHPTKTSVSFINPVHRWLLFLNSSCPFKISRQLHTPMRIPAVLANVVLLIEFHSSRMCSAMQKYLLLIQCPRNSCNVISRERVLALSTHSICGVTGFWNTPEGVWCYNTLLRGFRLAEEWVVEFLCELVKKKTRES